MLGFIGHSFLGERLYYVVKQPTRQAVSLADYLTYNDVIYHGRPEEKFINSFKMMDLEGDGRIALLAFLDFWQQFMKMYGQILHAKLKFTEQMREHFSQQFAAMAGERGYFTYDDYKAIKEEEPEFLSIIEDIGDLSLENANINEKHGDHSISRAEFDEYHAAVLGMFEETQEELKREFNVKEQNALLAKIGEALKVRHTQATGNWLKEQFLVGLTRKTMGGEKPKLATTRRRQSLDRFKPEDLGLFLLTKKTSQVGSMYATIEPGRASTPLATAMSPSPGPTTLNPTINHVDHESVNVSSKES